MKKKLLFGTFLIGIILINFTVMSDSNEYGDLNLQTLLTFKSAEAYELPEITVKPSEKSSWCKKLIGEEREWTFFPPFYKLKMIYSWGSIVTCTEDNGDGCNPHDCDA